MERYGYGQVVIGPPGSGKSTYCRGMREFLRGLERDVIIVNLDPANEEIDEEYVDIDIAELIRLDDVMEELELGPNGGMVYCVEFLECNLEWLVNKLKKKLNNCNRPYFLFDLPGQVEIFAHHASVRNIMAKLQKQLGLRLVAVHLVDAFHCSDAYKYISAVFLSLSAMLRLELPHVNVLSKIDLIEDDGTLPFNLDFYTEVLDLNYLLPLLPSTPKYNIEDESSTDTHQGKQPEPPKTLFEEKFQRLNGAICQLIEDYNLVAFHTLNIQDKQSLVHLIQLLDKANGYVEIITASELDMLKADPYDVSALQDQYMQ